MKGMDRETLADAFMLDADYVTHSADGRPKVVRLLRPVSRERLMNSTAWVRAG